MRIIVCLHAGATLAGARRLHPTDARAIDLARALGAEVVVVEALSAGGTAPVACTDALHAGAVQAVRVVDGALAAADPRTAAFVLAATVDRLTADMVWFGCDADPEGLSAIPAGIAHHLSASYWTDVTRFGPDGQATLRAGGFLCRLRLPADVVVGIASDAGDDGANAPPSSTAGQLPAGPQDTLPGTPPPPPEPAIIVLDLADLEIDPALIRRRDNLRGTTTPGARPLVTLQSPEAVAALLAPPEPVELPASSSRPNRAP